MKKLYPLLSVLFLISVGFGQKLFEVIETYKYGNIKSITYHKKIRDRIVKFKVEKYYHTGEKRSEVTYKNGEFDGLYNEWYESGQKKIEVTYKDGKEDGLQIGWHENGQMKYKKTYKDGKNIGLYTEWYENGQKSSEGNYNEEYDMYVHSFRYKGLTIEWYESGQKKSEKNYRDGKMISKREWNEDGSVKE